MDWVGYKVHFTETCDPGTAHVIVNVETTVASVPDAHLLTTVDESLVRRDGVRIVGPIAEDTSWQARADNG